MSKKTTELITIRTTTELNQDIDTVYMHYTHQWVDDAAKMMKDPFPGGPLAIPTRAEFLRSLIVDGLSQFMRKLEAKHAVCADEVK